MLLKIVSHFDCACDDCGGLIQRGETFFADESDGCSCFRCTREKLIVADARGEEIQIVDHNRTRSSHARAAI